MRYCISLSIKIKASLLKLKYLAFFAVISFFIVNSKIVCSELGLFDNGETLRYKIKYMGILPIGTIEFKVDKIYDEIDKQKYKFLLTGVTENLLRPIFWARFKAESLWDAKDMCSIEYKEELERKGREKRTKILIFDQVNHVLTNIHGHKIKIFPYCQDPLSLFYYIRKLELQIGKTCVVYLNGSKKNYKIVLEPLREKIFRVTNKSFSCFKIKVKITKIEFNGEERCVGKGYLLLTKEEPRLLFQVKIMGSFGLISLNLSGDHYR
ncbi:MAG: DUF3108 domain-containing protein [Candidatus Omnitrophota bacterium]